MKIILSIFIVSLIIGCASNKETHHYALLPKPVENPTMPKQNETHPSIGIGPLTFPDWLDQPSVVSYKPNNELKIPLYHVWAGDLDSMILNVLAANISDHTNWQNVIPFPWDNRHRPEYQIRIHIEEFSGTLGEDVQLKVKWALLGNQGKVEHFNSIEYLFTALDNSEYNTYVQGLNELVNQLSVKIAKRTLTHIKDS